MARRAPQAQPAPMNCRRQLAVLRAERELYVRFLTDCEARQSAPKWAASGAGLRDSVLRSIGRLRDVLADLERTIHQLESGGEA